MRSLIPFVLFIVVVTLAALPVDIRAAWPPDGLLVCGESGDQQGVKIISDGAGGSIVAWADSRDNLIYGQRFDGSGNPYWADGGIPLCSPDGGDRVLAMVSDDAGGAIIIFGDLFAQRVDGSGALLWGPNGIEVPSETFGELVAVADGAGGVIIVCRGDYLLAQKINSSGTPMWDAGPGYVIVSDAVAIESSPSIVADGFGGVLIAFQDDVGRECVQRVFSSGNIWTSGEPQVGYGSGNSVITGDGTGGAFIAWQWTATGDYNVSIQKVDANGALQWGSELIVCVPGNSEECPGIVSDGAGGAYVGWMDDRHGSYLIYAQRVDAYGNFLWTDNGVQVCQNNDFQGYPVLLPCEAGVIVVWEDTHSPDLIFGQKIDISGGQVWSQDGVQIIKGRLDGGPDEIHDYDFAADGTGGVLAVITDDRLMNAADIYAQSINTFGEPAAPEPVITDISDVPGDEGGYLMITLDRSERDDIVQVLQPVTNYDMWQKVDEVTSSSIVETGTQAGTILGSDDSRILLTAPSAVNPDGTWGFIGSFNATQSDEYIFIGTTFSDSTGSGNPYFVYIITAHTTNPFVWFISEPDSGYSVDNLAPEPPLGLASEQSYMPEGLQLTWDQNMENDLWYYGVYRGTSDDFIPESGNLIATPTGQEYLDGDWSWDVDYWYKISAVDIHGNESVFAVTGPGEITGDDPSPAPLATYLSQNYPNPFNPVTTIRFGLMEAGHVSLRIYDAAGRLVREVMDGDIPAGHYNENWDGLSTDGSRAASGVYFYRLSTKSFTETRKMILLR